MVVATIVGARPEFIKAAVLSKSLLSRPGTREVLIHTGQHYDEDLSDVFFRELAVSEPAHWLGIGSGPHGWQTAAMLQAIERVLQQETPDWVVVYGDTNSTLAGAVAAVKLQIPLAHIEAGLRSFNRAMPEEINRVLTDHSSDYLFAPTLAAVENLSREGINDGVFLVGDVMYDAVLQYTGMAEKSSRILERLNLTPKDYVLATVHRAENTDSAERLHAIFGTLEQIALDTPVLFPVHPRTRHICNKLGISFDRSRIRFIEPVGYIEMIALEKNSRVIVTDSGGVQKEAFFHRVQCVTLRSETEWVELVDSGWNRIAPPWDSGSMLAAIEAAMLAKPGAEIHPYGDGRSGQRIVEILASHYQQRSAKPHVRRKALSPGMESPPDMARSWKMQNG